MSSDAFDAYMQPWRERHAEHLRRKAEDPVYRAECEARAEREAKEEEERAQREQAELVVRLERNRVETVRRRANVPARVWSMLDSGQETDATRGVRGWEAGKETMLVLAGGVGCGKTVAACGAIDRAKGGRFVKAIDLVRAGTFDAEFWDELRYARLLVIDDLGTEPLDEKGWALAGLHSLIDSRYDDEARTILTTNLAFDAFFERYGKDGGRLRDRIREAGAFVEVAVPSMRKAPVQHWQEAAEDRDA